MNAMAERRMDVLQEIRILNGVLLKTPDQEGRERICRDIEALREELRAIYKAEKEESK
jgi:hypothetical protein